MIVNEKTRGNTLLLITRWNNDILLIVKNICIFTVTLLTQLSKINYSKAAPCQHNTGRAWDTAKRENVSE
jgi:hypothetical protein